MRTSKTLYWIALALVILGGLNWGLVGLFGLNPVAAIFGTGIAATIVYVIIALAALYILVIAASKPRSRILGFHL